MATNAVAGDQETGLPQKLLARHKQHPGCVDPSDPMMPQEGLGFSARLDEDTQIYGIMCEPSAYNFPYAIYVVRGGYFEDAERVYFADYNLESGWTGSAVLYNAHFDQSASLLKGFSKGRGLGDCGSKSAFKWDGDAFVMSQYRYKENCDQDFETPFPLIYKRYQKPGAR